MSCACDLKETRQPDADIRLFSGLDGEYLDLEAAGVRAPIPW
jgi:hypothetical protein